MTRVGIGIDSHRFAEGRPLILGGVEVPHDLGLDGHSDADVLSHAIVDAMLGAVAAGDIGTHFPPDDPAWKDADSRVFLAAALEAVRRAGYAIGNVDATILAEAPKLAPHLPEMRRQLADTLDVGVEAISVKATTAERMGALGRGEGMACHAVVLLVPD